MVPTEKPASQTSKGWGGIMSGFTKAAVYLLMAWPAVAPSQAFEKITHKTCSRSRPERHARTSPA